MTARSGYFCARIAAVRGKVLFTFGGALVLSCLAAPPSTVGAVTKAQQHPSSTAAPAVSVSTPQMADLALDEAHNLLYGSDINGGKVWIFSLPTLSTVATIDVGPQSQPIGMDISQDGTMLAVARTNAQYRNIALIDTASRKVVGTLSPSVGTPWDVRFGRQGRLYSVGFPSGTVADVVHVWDLTSLTEVGRSACCTGDAQDVVITADGNTLYESEIGQTGLSIVRFDTSTDTPVALGATPPVQFGGAVAIKPDGSRVYNSNGEVWSGNLQARLGTLPGPGTSQAVAYAPGGDLVLTAVQPAVQNAITRANGTTLAAMGTRNLPQLTALSVNAGGTVAYVGTLTGLESVDFAAPDAPVGVNAQAGIGSAIVRWLPPADAGTSPITSYDIVSSGGARVSVPASQTSAVLTGLSSAPHTFTVDAVNASGAGPGAVSAVVTPQAGGTYHALSPVRILDTRNGTGGVSSPIGPAGMLTLQVAGRGGVPASGVSAVTLNVTVTDTTASSFLTLWPAGTPLPVVSNLNWVPGETVPNLVEVALGIGGQVSLFNLAGSTDVVVDVEGYVGDSTNSSGPVGMFNGLVPARLLDTRNGIGSLGTGQTLTLQVTGRGGLPPTGVSAVVLNVTVTNTTGDSFLTVYPTGGSLPVASNLNWVAGKTVPNRVIVKVGTGGQVSIFNRQGNVDVVVDVNGWFTDATSTAGGSGFVATIPGRFYDERNDPQGPLPGGFFLKLGVNDPRTITGLVLNVTATDTTASSFLTVWPDATPLPLASDLNWVAGETVPNLTVVELNSSAFDVFNFAGLVDVVIDVDGFYSGVVQPVSPALAAGLRGAVAGQENAEGGSAGTQLRPVGSVERAQN